MKYVKKSLVIDAFCWTGDENQVEDPEWACEAVKNKTLWFKNVCTPEVVLMIETLEGTREARRGDYIIKGIAGEFYPCRPEIFEATYELVENNDE